MESLREQEIKEDVDADVNGLWVGRGLGGCGEQVSGPGFELHLHLADGFHDDAGESAAPAGVDGGDDALFRVDEENGDAVGGLYCEEEVGTVGDGGVPMADFGRSGVEKMDDVGMDLFQGDKLLVGGAEGGLEEAAVF